MSGGQHRDDEGNGPSWSSERETERRRNRKEHLTCAAAQKHGCAQKKKILRRNVLDGADFVRDVRNNCPKSMLYASVHEDWDAHFEQGNNLFNSSTVSPRSIISGS